MISRQIWIPSLQRYEYAKEFSNEQYRNLLKVLDDDQGFDRQLEKTFHEIFENSQIVKLLTMIDKFVVFLQMKIYSYSEDLVLTMTCDKCGFQTKISKNLNSLLDDLANTIDKPFGQMLEIKKYVFHLDVPPAFGNFITSDTIDDKINKYLYSFIKNIFLDGKNFHLDSKDSSSKNIICKSLPFDVMLTLKGHVIDPIYKILKNILEIKKKCSNPACSEILNLSFDANTLDDAIKILMKDDSAVNFIAEYASIASKTHLGYDFFQNTTPAEMKLISAFLEKEESSKEETSSKEINMFEKYRLETEGMVESDSEFK